jgi:cobalt/nickel transport protein
MNTGLKNGVLIAVVASLTLLPLITVTRTTGGPDGKTVEIFKSSDSQAAGVIKELAPDYKPWFPSIIKPPSGEIESLLFALQAAIGAGFIGYYAGYSRGRSKKSSTPRAN